MKQIYLFAIVFMAVLSANGKITIPDSWDPYCTATYEDGWVVPGMGREPSAYPMTVKVEKNAAMEGVYRLVDPYLADKFPLKHLVETGGYIVIDISDPETVGALPGFYSGFSYYGKFYNYNIEGNFLAMGYDPLTIRSSIKRDGRQCSVYKDGVVTLHNCVYDTKESCDCINTWEDQNGMDIWRKMISKITFDIDPGSVGTIGAQEMSKVEYYTLQGVKIENPESGQLVIKKTANGAVKTIIR